jgi:hypothetical protein
MHCMVGREHLISSWTLHHAETTPETLKHHQPHQLFFLLLLHVTLSVFTPKDDQLKADCLRTG